MGRAKNFSEFQDWKKLHQMPFFLWVIGRGIAVSLEYADYIFKTGNIVNKIINGF